MIEVVIDFNEIYRINDCSKFTDKDTLMKCKLFTYIYSKLNINNIIAVNWDAFKDNIWSFRFKEIPKDYVYDPNDKWEWESYEEYEWYLDNDRTTGFKGEDGLRDDLRLVFVNFQPFFIKHRGLAGTLLEVLFGYIEETRDIAEDDDLLAMEICIK